MNPIGVQHNPRGLRLIIVLSVFLLLAIISVGLRLWGRRIQRKSLVFNDYAIMVGLLFTCILYGIEVEAVVECGFGLHVTQIYMAAGLPTIVKGGKLAFAADIMWNASITTIKLSILHLYLSIFIIPSFRRICWITGAVCLVCGCAFIVTAFLICKPVAFFWDKSILYGKCGNERIAYMVPGVINMALDIVIFSLPMPLLWGLQLPTAKKLATTFVFGIGLGICLIAGIRLKFVLALNYEDFTYSIIDFAIFGPLEPMLGIISACLPMLPPILARFSKNKRLLAWRSKGDSGVNGAGSSGKQSAVQTFGSKGALRTFGSSGPMRTFGNSGSRDESGFDKLDDEGDYPLVEYAARSVSPVGDDNRIKCTTRVTVNSSTASVAREQV
ncbi:hypothetical protein B0J11DRAFT_539612 [Dendryphion nanum]|uniref:Rhodopsin domain-containing protein n=1 Tax=Dendryphion nanum TaxID=256645 RepID=A0A9P9ICM1_9PLEO|nr:hypothetical protein B0J11DRAFT_539612 [Dendryphion nanum]